MENQRYKNLLKKAQENRLTVNDINEIVLVMHDQNMTDNREMKKAISQNTRGLRDIEEEYPLLPPEADDLSRVVRRKGVEVLGGKKSNAYENKALRRRVYQDIYGEVKRQFGLISETGAQLSYKKLKRKYLSGAFMVVESYVAPISIENEIAAENDLDFDE